MEVDPLASFKVSVDGPGQHLDCDLMKDPEPELPSQAVLEFLAHRKGENEFSGYKPLNLGVIFLVNIGNKSLEVPLNIPKTITEDITTKAI